MTGEEVWQVISDLCPSYTWDINKNKETTNAGFHFTIAWDAAIAWVYFHRLEVVVLSGEAQHFNPLTAKLFNWNFHPLEVVSRWRDPQRQVSEN